ncbi:MAG: hypothetical protein J3T61_12340, partial [Candidatus Brocadiales bacterium]|nr:hypothetical protein [Candidatus Bathyanammoxibius sp.]
MALPTKPATPEKAGKCLNSVAVAIRLWMLIGDRNLRQSTIILWDKTPIERNLPAITPTINGMPPKDFHHTP